MIRLVIILNSNNIIVVIFRNRKIKVRLPRNAPKIILFKEAFLFNVRFTVINNKKSIIKFSKAMRSIYRVISSPNLL